MAMNCDRIAAAYRWLEYLSFGATIQHCRTHFLGAVRQSRFALILGDGDGRFLASYLHGNPAGRVESVDISPRMLALAQRRAALAPGANARVRFILSDARSYSPSPGYDLVVTHFFLDCLREDEIDALAARLRHSAAPRARWLVSEFRIPAGPIARPLAQFIVGALYQFFGLFTGLALRQLPDYRRPLERHGFHLLHHHYRLGGLLTSELWELSPKTPPAAG
jgi:SAM-dependent methyltransferase